MRGICIHCDDWGFSKVWVKETCPNYGKLKDLKGESYVHGSWCATCKAYADEALWLGRDVRGGEGK